MTPVLYGAAAEKVDRAQDAKVLQALRSRPFGASVHILEEALPDMRVFLIMQVVDTLAARGQVRKVSSWTGPWYYAIA
jgi:hypothetical protein